MAIVTVGIDLAKNVFALHGVDATGKSALVRPSVARGKLLEMVAALPPYLIGMEACSGAHHWARLLAAHGYTVRLIAPKLQQQSALLVHRARQGFVQERTATINRIRGLLSEFGVQAVDALARGSSGSAAIFPLHQCNRPAIPFLNPTV